MSIAYCWGEKASPKRVHLTAQVHNTEVKWSIKPCIVQKNIYSKELRQKLVEWIMKYSNVRESPISRDTLLITYAESGENGKFQNSYWIVPCESFTMISSLHQMM